MGHLVPCVQAELNSDCVDWAPRGTRGHCNSERCWKAGRMLRMSKRQFNSVYITEIYFGESDPSVDTFIKMCGYYFYDSLLLKKTILKCSFYSESVQMEFFTLTSFDSSG